jgi:hypothetical protein
MWIFTTYGFFSFTQSAFEPGKIQIRARDDRDLEDLKKRHKLRAKIVETDNSDYRWRILVTPATAAKIMAGEVEAIDYANFKNATTDRMHARPLMEVWTSMMRVQRQREAALRPPEPRTRPRGRHSDQLPGLTFGDLFALDDEDDDIDWKAHYQAKGDNHKAYGYGRPPEDDRPDEAPF